MNVSPETSRRLAAARDIGAVLVFCALTFLGGRAVINAPFLQKERLSGTKAAADIKYFFAQAEKLHTGRPSGPTTEQYSSLKARALAEVKAGLDEFGRLKIRDLAYILYRCAAAFQDENTKILWRPPRKWKDPEAQFPPFRVEYVRGRFLIGGTLGPELAGAELLELNGAPFPEFIKPALERISGSSPRYRAYSFCREQAFWWQFSGLLSGKTTFTVKVRFPSGKIGSRELEPVSAGGFRGFSEGPLQPPTMLYPNRHAGWLTAADMTWSRRERKRYDRFFKDLAALGTPRLVLDLRDTHAGDVRMADYLLSLLTRAHEKPGGSFAGRITLIIGPGTGPTGALFAARFRELKAGEILGEETGCAPARSGPRLIFKLPASGMRCAVSSIPGPQASAAGVVPDLVLTEKVLRPYKGDVRNFVLERLGKAESEK